jgi:RNA polymerase sigma factor (sigma-70 family)
MVSECQVGRRRPKTYWIDDLVIAYQDAPSENRFAAILAGMRQAILGVLRRMGVRGQQAIDEAMSDGWKALLVAARQWDRNRAGFAAYGTLVIKREIILGLRERAPINRTIWRRQSRISTVCDQLSAELYRRPSDREVAERFGISERELVVIQNEPHNRLSLPGAEWAHTIAWPDMRPENPDQPLVVGDVRRAMQGLERRTRKVLERRFFDGWKLREIAAEAGLSKQRVHQIIQEALREIRQQLEGTEGAP